MHVNDLVRNLHGCDNEAISAIWDFENSRVNVDALCARLGSTGPGDRSCVLLTAAILSQFESAAVDGQITQEKLDGIFLDLSVAVDMFCWLNENHETQKRQDVDH